MRHLLLAISLIGLVVAVIAFIDNRTLRADIHGPLGKGGKTPEEEIPWGYSKEKLRDFAGKLSVASTRPNQTWLDLYRHPALLWNDVIFALALGIFSACLWLWVLQFVLSGALHCLLVVMTASSLLYGIVDTAEDIVLERLLREPQAITDSQARAATTLTQLKILTIFCSGAGGITWAVLQYSVPERPAPIFFGK